MDKWEIYSTYSIYDKKHSEYMVLSEQNTTICTAYSKELAEQIVREHNSFTMLLQALRHIVDITEDDFIKEYAEKILSKVSK